jgi:hypothetical protein
MVKDSKAIGAVLIKPMEITICTAGIAKNSFRALFGGPLFF